MRKNEKKSFCCLLFWKMIFWQFDTNKSKIEISCCFIFSVFFLLHNHCHIRLRYFCLSVISYVNWSYLLLLFWGGDNFWTNRNVFFLPLKKQKVNKWRVYKIIVESFYCVNYGSSIITSNVCQKISVMKT